ncbi:Eco57I restriction-modification methylase domain-containing protein [Agrobacterium salinitolerans]|uniref:Eco57I restriction-modification methylase domain-containing protein n=1 Tax=Agrobacterium salinitolerans TaxID=1183413 RepID=UPI0013F5BB3E|nr:N-6 DNA methylase [Agrobacterium salinitolerans]
MKIIVDSPVQQLEKPDAISTGTDLAIALGWAAEGLEKRKISVGHREIIVETANLQGEGAVMFTRLDDHATRQELDTVALYGYHSSCPWGIVADEEGIHVLSTRWLRDNDWYRLPPIQWKEVTNSASLLSAFAPSGVRSSAPQRNLLALEEPTTFLQAVDDALVERLDNWRERAVRYSKGAVTKVDAQLQTLYAQLFVLRTVEDRGLDDTIPSPLEACKGADQFDFDRWGTIYKRAKARIGSDLFTDDIAREIEPFILTGIIRDLYFPKRIPGRDVRYDFSWISADVLGLAYEKYLSTVLQPAPLPAQTELFAQPQRGVERLSVRKSAGAYYTPRFLTGYLAGSCIKRFYENASPDALPYVIDFACGSGSFLVAAVDHLLGHLKRHDPSKAWARKLIEGGHIAGIDIDPKAVTAARLHVWQRVIEEPDALPLPNLSDIIRVGDGLNSATWNNLDKQYDIVLGNPPFLATSLVANREKLEAEFETARGRYDFSSLFVEQALKVLREGGRLGLVIPNRLFLNKSAEPLRALLSIKSAVDVIVDFGSTKVFDADAYVGCIIAEKTDGHGIINRPVRVIRVQSLEPDYMTAELFSAEDRDVVLEGGTLKSYKARQPGKSPWSLLSVAEQRNRIAMDEISVRLDSIATVAQGIRTGANDLFILDVEDDDGAALARVRNGLGESWFVERDLLEPVVFGPELQRYSLTSPSRRLLYPYRNNVALTETELRERYPRAYEYFFAYRDLLSARSSLKGTGSNYYELIRPRDERWIRCPKLLIRDLAPSTAFALDERGTAFIVSGTAVVPADAELCLPLCAYLNSQVVNSLIKQQTPSFRGDFQKFEPGVLSSIPVLIPIAEDEIVAGQLRDFAIKRMRCTEGSTDAKLIEQQIDSYIIQIASSLGADLVL